MRQVERPQWGGFVVDVENHPLKRAGLYLIQHIGTGRPYIGATMNMHRRSFEHGRGHHGPKLGRAIKKHGRAAFRFVPLYYSTDGSTTELLEIEALLIADFGSVKDGYNVHVASRGIGPYGEGHREACRRAARKPGAREKRSAASKRRFSSAEARQELSDRAHKRLSTPEAKAKQAKNFGRDDPEKEAKRKAAAKAGASTPEAKAKHLVAIRALVATPEWRANNRAARKLSLSDPVRRPARVEQLRKRAADPAHRAKLSVALKAYRARLRESQV